MTTTTTRDRRTEDLAAAVTALQSTDGWMHWLQVRGSLGLDVSASSVAYIAGWAAEQSAETLRKHAGTIDALAKQIEDAVLGIEHAATDEEPVLMAA